MTITVHHFEENTAALPIEQRFWYEPTGSAGGRYWHQASDGTWVHRTVNQFRNYLLTQGLIDYIPEAEKGTRKLSELDQLKEYIEVERRIDYAGPVAGRRAGFMEWNGGKILVTRSVKLIDPVPPSPLADGADLFDFQAHGFPVLGAVLDGLFNGVEQMDDSEERFEQLPRFLTWMWHFLDSLYRDKYSTGLALGLAGEPNCGKTLLAQIIKEVSGGIVAKPFERMTGRDNFNEEWLWATLLLIDDENSETHIQERLRLGAEVKKVVANQDGCRIRGLHRTAINVPAIQRLVICVNLEPERLQVLPPIDNDIRDKLLILKGYSRPFPMPSSTIDEREAFWATIRRELPHFVWYMTRVWSPSRDTLDRFGGQSWQHPQVIEELGKLSPEARTMEFIDRWMRKSNPRMIAADLAKAATAQRALLQRAMRDGSLPGWIGTASDLRSVLVADGDDAPLSTFERREVRASAYLGRDLEALSRRHPRNIMGTRQPGSGARNWIILPNPVEEAANGQA